MSCRARAHTMAEISQRPAHEALGKHMSTPGLPQPPGRYTSEHEGIRAPSSCRKSLIDTTMTLRTSVLLGDRRKILAIASHAQPLEEHRSAKARRRLVPRPEARRAKIMDPTGLPEQGIPIRGPGRQDAASRDHRALAFGSSRGLVGGVGVPYCWYAQLSGWRNIRHHRGPDEVARRRPRPRLFLELFVTRRGTAHPRLVLVPGLVSGNTGLRGFFFPWFPGPGRAPGCVVPRLGFFFLDLFLTCAYTRLLFPRSGDGGVGEGSRPQTGTAARPMPVGRATVARPVAMMISHIYLWPL
jgi:hypothetical protein